MYFLTGSPEARMLVARGALLLDQYFRSPLWDRRVRWWKLQMWSTTNCVLGQVFGYFVNYPNELDEQAGGVLQMAKYGFMPTSTISSFDLGRAWRRLIWRRRWDRRRRQ